MCPAGLLRAGPRRALFVVLAVLALASTVSSAPAADFCGRPVSGDDKISATDCLFILQAGIGAQSCRLCVCDIDGDGDLSASDALICLRAAVGIGIDQACPVCSEPTTTTSTTTTLVPTSTSSTTTTSTLGVPEACGDGRVEPPEQCDDGNRLPGDGCAADCSIEDARGLCAGVPTSASATVAAELLASGFARPVDLASPPLDTRRLFVVEQGGLVKIIKDGAVLPDPFLDLRGRASMVGGNERGLLGIAFDPGYQANRRFFVNYTDATGRTVVARYLRDPADEDLAMANSEAVLFTVQQPFTNHNGGRIAFGPDGMLYVGMGDGGSGGDPGERAQDPSTVLGKMLRLDVRGDSAPFYSVPPDNPDPSAPGLLGLIWASGLRNPWRFSFDAPSGRLFIADVGQSKREEIDVVDVAGSGYNFGWDPFEGTLCFDPQPLGATCDAISIPFVDPVLEYPHPEGCSVTGGYVYRGCALPALAGTYFYADFCTHFVRSFKMGSTSVFDARDRTLEVDPPGGLDIASISTFGRDARGELYIADLDDGEVFKIVAGP